MIFKFIIIIIIILLIIFISYIIYNNARNNVRNKDNEIIPEENADIYYKDDMDHYSILSKDTLQDNHIKEFYVNEDIILVEDKCFVNCLNLATIKVSEYNNNYCSKFGILFTKDMKTILCYPPLKQTSTYFIPQGVENINTHAFCNNNFLKYIIIPTSIEYIGENSFVNCKYLNQIAIPESVTDIHPRAFSLCPRLTIRCYKNSIAEDFCKKYYIPCEYLNKKENSKA